MIFKFYFYIIYNYIYLQTKINNYEQYYIQ